MTDGMGRFPRSIWASDSHVDCSSSREIRPRIRLLRAQEGVGGGEQRDQTFERLCDLGSITSTSTSSRRSRDSHPASIKIRRRSSYSRTSRRNRSTSTPVWTAETRTIGMKLFDRLKIRTPRPNLSSAAESMEEAMCRLRMSTSMLEDLLANIDQVKDEEEEHSHDVS